jgi:hypothetical protein
MDVNVDIGKNLTSLLEKLAQQIGMTTEQIFPWYVQQAYVEGVTGLAGLGLGICIFSVVLIFSHKKADWDNGNGHAWASLVSIFGLAAVLLFSCVGGMTSVRKMMNPNFYAMQEITIHIGRLAGK